MSNFDKLANSILNEMSDYMRYEDPNRFKGPRDLTPDEEADDKRQEMIGWLDQQREQLGSGGAVHPEFIQGMKKYADETNNDQLDSLLDQLAWHAVGDYDRSADLIDEIENVL